ncbi:uncharacterized protein EI97DRAFT_104333 [Westerdykella ornata]|uniref:Uncharacterized protein n=1 Tax=Westerdykella ornata TaxID=318751 RepID=A0A6A6JUT9_WESOR|nr:uncharacterized protein EI97DRAFT_104333 [Westerdykella ornata]KAF2279863.1 hypothetical protein EI97DRAFT_104333 [Westerdykella ornata]
MGGPHPTRSKLLGSWYFWWSGGFGVRAPRDSSTQKGDFSNVLSSRSMGNPPAGEGAKANGGMPRPSKRQRRKARNQATNAFQSIQSIQKRAPGTVLSGQYRDLAISGHFRPGTGPRPAPGERRAEICCGQETAKSPKPAVPQTACNPDW